MLRFVLPIALLASAAVAENMQYQQYSNMQNVDPNARQGFGYVFEKFRYYHEMHFWLCMALDIFWSGLKILLKIEYARKMYQIILSNRKYASKLLTSNLEKTMA